MQYRIYVLLFTILTPFLLADAQSKYRENTDEAIKAAEDFEAAVFSSVPKASKFISYFDIDIADGHLMLWAKDILLQTRTKTQDQIYETLLDMWRGTKYVKVKKYAGWIEVLSLAGTTIRRLK